MSSFSLINEQDIQTIKNKNYRLIFVVGIPGCRKGSQTEKLSKEFKYPKISMRNIIMREVASNSDIGKQIYELKSNGKPLPSEIDISLLCNNLKNCESKTVIIDGFPNRLEDALYFEQNIMPIDSILKFNGSEETCLHNLNEAGDESLKHEELKKIYEIMDNDFNILDNFYSPYSIIRDIDINNKKIGEINTLVKQCLYPTIYSIIGKRYSGKTELSKVLNERMGIKLIDFNIFLKKPEIKKKINDVEFVVSKFISELREMRDIRVLIEDFPQNKEQYSYFINNCKPFEKILFLKAENASCLERLNKIPLDDSNYISSSELNKLLYEFEQKKTFYEFLKNNSKVEEINVNNHKILTIKQMVKQIQPYCAYIETQPESNAKEELFNRLSEKYGYKEILLPKIIENAIKRKIIEKSENDEYSLELKIKLIRSLIFSEKNKKLILNSFPVTMEELTAFENGLCYISKYIALTETHNLSNINNEDSTAVYCYKNNLLASLNPKYLNKYEIEECKI